MLPLLNTFPRLPLIEMGCWQGRCINTMVLKEVPHVYAYPLETCSGYVEFITQTYVDIRYVYFGYFLLTPFG